MILMSVVLNSIVVIIGIIIVFELGYFVIEMRIKYDTIAIK
jgi:hypothetical protein